jgi:hypothetical protein
LKIDCCRLLYQVIVDIVGLENKTIADPISFAISFGIGIGLNLVGALLTPPQVIGKLDAKNRRVPPSEPGSPLPMLYGAYYVAGALVDARPEYREEKQRRGKIGGKVVEYKYYGDFCYVFCEYVPNAKLVRLKLNGEIVIDFESSNTNELIKSQEFYDRYVRFYDGNKGQLPDPTLQQIWGIDNTPAHRGVLSIVLHDFELTDYGNRPPSIEAYIAEAGKTWSGQVRILKDSPVAIGAGTPPDDYLLGRYSDVIGVGLTLSTSSVGKRGKLLVYLNRQAAGTVGLCLPPQQGQTGLLPYAYGVGRSGTTLTIQPVGSPATTFTNPDWTDGLRLEFRLTPDGSQIKCELWVNGNKVHEKNIGDVQFRAQSQLTAGVIGLSVVTQSEPKNVTRNQPQSLDLCSLVDRLLLSGLNANQIDTSELKGKLIRGGILDQSNARDKIAELQKTYYFDLIETDGTLKALKPKRPTTAPLIPTIDMGATESGNSPNPLFEIERIADSEIPYELELTYFDPLRDDVNSVYARSGRYNPKYVKIDLAATMYQDEAQALANIALRLAQLRSQSFKFSTTLDWAHLLPGDLHKAQPYGIEQTYQLTQQTLGTNLVLEHSALPYDGKAWDLLPKFQNLNQKDLVETILEEPKVVAFRLPQNLRSTDPTPCLYLGVGSGGGWATATFWLSVNNGQSYYYVGETRRQATIALLNTNWDAAGASVVIRAEDGQFNSITANEFTVTTYLNQCVVVGKAYTPATATKEVIQFRDATLLGQKTYKLTNFKRGQLGTAAQNHPANAWFVLIDTAIVAVPLDPGIIGATVLLKVLIDNEPDAPAISLTL